MTTKLTPAAFDFQMRSFGRTQFAGLIGIALLTALMCLPFTHTVYWLGDEGILLHGASEMASGKKIYADFWELYPPGGFLIALGWLTVFGHSLISARVLVILVITAISSLTYGICMLVSTDDILSFVLVLTWVIGSQSSWTVLAHHWLTTLFSMATFLLCVITVSKNDAGVSKAFWAGLSAGMAAMVTQSRGLYLILAALGGFTVCRKPKNFVAFAFSTLIAPGICLLYLVFNDEASSAFDDVVLFPLHQYSSIQGVPFGAGAAGRFLPELMFPLAGFLIAVVLIFARERVCRDARFWTCTFFGLAGFFGVFPRPDVVHLNFDLPMVFPIVTYCVSNAGFKALEKFRYALSALIVIFYLPSDLDFLQDARIAVEASTVRTSAGPIALFGNEANGARDLFAFIESKPGTDRYFFYPYMPMMPFLTARTQVSKIDYFVPEYTTAKQYAETCQDTILMAQWIVIEMDWIDPHHWKGIFPALKDPDPPEKHLFEQAIFRNFSMVGQFGDYEVLGKNNLSDTSLCSRIQALEAERR